MSTRYLFVGERRSPTAIARGWTWRDGRLAAKQLHDALRATGIDPDSDACAYVNLWTDGGRAMFERLRKKSDGRVIVALGSLVADALRAASVPHVALVHPAARGKIRKKARYAEHVRAALAEVWS